MLGLRLGFRAYLISRASSIAAMRLGMVPALGSSSTSTSSAAMRLISGMQSFDKPSMPSQIATRSAGFFDDGGGSGGRGDRAGLVFRIGRCTDGDA